MLNLSHHGFSISPTRDERYLRHEATIDADRFAAIEGDLIPTGELIEVKGTPMDFTRPTPVGARIDQDDEQLVRGRGYDHTRVLIRQAPRPFIRGTSVRANQRTSDEGLHHGARHPVLHRQFRDGATSAKAVWCTANSMRCAWSVSTSIRPIGQSSSTVLKPGQRYEQTTVYRFTGLSDGDDGLVGCPAATSAGSAKAAGNEIRASLRGDRRAQSGQAVERAFFQSCDRLYPP